MIIVDIKYIYAGVHSIQEPLHTIDKHLYYAVRQP